MSKATFFNEFGSPNVLIFGEIKDRDPGENEIQIRQKAIGVNYIDAEYRSGNLNSEEGTKVCGIEAVGVIEKVGANVKDFLPGQRVAYATAKNGAYRELRTIDARHVISIPDEITFEQAASSLADGMTAHYLTNRTFLAKTGTAVLVHAAASNIGVWSSMFARRNGALVIGTASDSEEEIKIASTFCHKVFNYNDAKWPSQVKEFTKGIGVSAVYESLGKETFEGSIEALMDIGMIILSSELTGKIGNIPMDKIRNKSLFLTYPNLHHYKANKMELILSAEEVFQSIIGGEISPLPPTKLPLEKAFEAHQLIETGKMLGSMILLP